MRLAHADADRYIQTNIAAHPPGAGIHVHYDLACGMQPSVSAFSIDPNILVMPFLQIYKGMEGNLNYDTVLKVTFPLHRLSEGVSVYFRAKFVA